MSGINIIQGVDKVPTSSYVNSHYFCDYIELLALLNNTDIVSFADVYDRFLKDGKIVEIGTEESAETNDTWESRISEWFELLSIREIEFGDFYPFLISGDKIRLKKEMDSPKNAYIFLLLSSNGKYIKDKNLLTTDFEIFSYEVLKSYLPSFAQIFQFGKSNISHDRYTGHITEKINTLATDLKCNTTYKSHFFSSTNTGDGGLDIVAWVPFENDVNQCNIQVYLGQCATGKDWLDKQDDTHKFPHKYIKFDGHINYIMFIPYDGRDTDRNFIEEKDMGDYLFFDRYRLLKTLDNYNLVESLPSFDEIVQKVIDFEEDII
jgi:hypothetical protein